MAFTHGHQRPTPLFSQEACQHIIIHVLKVANSLKTEVQMSKRLASAAQLEQRLAALDGHEWDSASDNEEVTDDRYMLLVVDRLSGRVFVVPSTCLVIVSTVSSLSNPPISLKQ
jgi:hypothetical protein